MDTTINRGYPYPECEPPVQKDASDIIQMSQLATAIDSDVQGLSDTIETQMAYPPNAKMFTNAIVTTQSDFSIFYTNTAWSTRTGLADPTMTGGFVIQEPGWYLATGFVTATTTLQLQMRTRLLVNGVQTGIWQGYSRNTTGIPAQAQQLQVSLFLDAGQFVTTIVRHGFPGTSISFSARLSLLQLVASA
ncbi:MULTISPECIES: hypothetical protein [unclassified Streptomyces]|uniref:hypothetical protein n=1 Tax=unclassified Streptomyces TaxID=2593676 RepID=UPI00081DFCC1|nr:MULTISPECIES: hypothetical protein [unclassified Streptomyces]MYZ35472.1 hypothetical protein [Streptomyces sp. SID4917]SCF75753.1 hypothetical protein GA0115259_102125 [Streptomyces sp. MnatMP-M17]